MHSIQKLRTAIVAELSPDLLKPQYLRLEKRNRFTGHCYVASEALYHLRGGVASGLLPQCVRHEGGVHWYLKRQSDGHIFDLTARQFSSPPPYEIGKGCGFLTKKPSKRCQVLIRRVKARLRTV